MTPTGLLILALLDAVLLAALLIRWARPWVQAARRMNARRRLAYQARLVLDRRERDRRRAEVPIDALPGPAEQGIPEPSADLKRILIREQIDALRDELHLRRN